MDTAERRRASRLDAAGMPGSARAPYRASGARRNLRFLWRRGPKTLKIFFACGGQLISLLSLSQLFHTTLSVTRSVAVLYRCVVYTLITVVGYNVALARKAVLVFYVHIHSLGIACDTTH